METTKSGGVQLKQKAAHLLEDTDVCKPAAAEARGTDNRAEEEG